MKKVVYPDYCDVCCAAADIFAKQLAKKPDSVFGFATGGTPIGIYDELVQRAAAGKLDFSKARAFNLDEYYPIARDHPQSYWTYMNRHLYDKVPFAGADMPNGEASDPQTECERYDKAIESAGGIDLQLLGIGINGHIGFNEPTLSYPLGTHLVKLTESTLTANSRFFTDGEAQPTTAITMGIDTIFRAKQILMIITGAVKAEIARRLFEGKLHTNIPASFLLLHPNVTVILDEEASLGNYSTYCLQEVIKHEQHRCRR